MTATTLQVRNPAGISTAVPITVQANAAQLFTADGKSVLGVHANGSALSKTAPAAPGETIVIYATGLGATNPALTPGQLPIEASGLVTLPKVTIGPDTATVVSAGTVPGNAAMYQITVQVPSNAANGDLPVVLSVGTFSAAQTVLTVQK